MSWQKYLLLPQLIWYGVRGPRHQAVAWDRYWGAIRRTGAGGEVLWDAGSETEIHQSLERLLAHMDRTLPIIDVGCGNGRHTRALALHFPRAIGIDVAPQAIAKAWAESQDVPNVSFRILDASVPGTGRRLVEELGEVNVYMRGVLHILDHQSRLALLQNVREILGQRGTFYFLETDFAGSPLSYLESIGAKLGMIPLPLRHCIVSGINSPGHFGKRQHRTYFPDEEWETLASGETDVHTISLRTEHELEHIPGFFAIVRPRRTAS